MLLLAQQLLLVAQNLLLLLPLPQSLSKHG